jgi:hypothetical protein
MGLEPSRMAEAIVRNARIRDQGTRNLLTAAAAAGARRVVAQSIAWAYAPGPVPHRQSDPLDLGAVGSRAVSVRGIAALEYRTLNSPPLAALRYGQPGNGVDAAAGPIPSMSMLPPTLPSSASTRAHPASSTLSSPMTTLPPKRQPPSSAGMPTFVSKCRAHRLAGKLTANRASGRAGVMAEQEGDGVFATQRQRDVLLRFDGIAP